MNAEHFSKTNNNNNNDEKESANKSSNPLSNINIIKEGVCDKRLSHTHFYNNNNYNNNTEFGNLFNYLNIDDIVKQASCETTRPEFLNIRVKRSIKMLYTLLGLHEKRLLRDVVENLILQFYTNRQVFEQKHITINLNVNQVFNAVNDANADVIKFKKEIDRLRGEVEKLLSENIELRRELESLRKKQSQTPQSRPIQFELERVLIDVYYTLTVVKKCFEIECDKQLLSEIIDKSITDISRTFNIKIRNEIVNAILNRIKK